ncbi:hypothetical protein FB451DRAFT_1384477 [Mycena latifolia]|nr:hypothetical protein FB451DRAFT_1384477 [Mycena latifolia]
MSPWTLPELVAASSLQPTAHPEKLIKSFYETFGGSARHVYRQAHKPGDFEWKIDCAASRLSADDIERIFLASIVDLSVPGHVGLWHMLLSAFPLSDEDRTQWQIKSPTSAMENKVLERLYEDVDPALAWTRSRAMAGDLLEKHHKFLSLGGTWPLRVIEKPWVANSNDSGFALRANGTMFVILTDDRELKDTRFTTVRTLSFPNDKPPVTLRVDLYYWPEHPTLRMFDSFYVDRPDHAIVFQASERKTLVAGVHWLKARGITKMTYIRVTQANVEIPPTVVVPEDLEKVFDSFYHLRLACK